jgi:mannitol/fructose-specific phosphotransferase system IIA component (Ntr-type)/Kef-type K+ transport system membrane component KefB
VLLSALAVSTAPATIVAVVKEARARGVFVKTLVAAVALNNMACVFLFEVARTWARTEAGAEHGSDITAGVISATVQLVGALVLGGVVGGLFTFLSDRATRADGVATAGMVAILFTYGGAILLDVSPLLACVFLGAVQTNATPEREKVVDSVFISFEPAILAVFFTLAGMSLEIEHIGAAGAVAIAFFGARVLGKMGAAGLAMRIAGAPRKLRRYLGVALVPQAGLAIGLVILLESDEVLARDEALIGLFTTVVLAAVTLAEITGPILTHRGLAAAGEVGKDRVRLIDFLQEENIVTGLAGNTKTELMERLTDLLISSHHLRDVNRDDLLATVLEREGEASTCLGGGLFVPHGILPEGTDKMFGVMGISSDGLSFDTPDGKPVHCAVLLATPPEQRQRHLEVLATLARVVGTDPVIQDRLFHCKSPAHAYEILHGDETEDFNYFLED